MKYVLIFATAALLVAQTPFNPVVPDNTPSSAQPRPGDDEPEAYPGQHDHAQPPDGWTCHMPPADLSGDQAHWCNCERSCDQETQVIHEDKQCKTFCHGDHCTCPMSGAKRCMPDAQQ